MKRRDFLAAVGAMAGTTALGCPARGSGQSEIARRRLERIGIQLYSVRTEMQRDLPGTLARLARIGYREVEFAGYFGRSPGEIRALLESSGLTAPSTHVAFDQLKTSWDAALDGALAMGHEFVTVPWLAADARRTRDDWRRLADDFNRAGERARTRGLRLAYHNHDFEFQAIEGETLLDTLLAHTDAGFVSFELDIYWMVRAGRDPLEYVRRHPSRFSMLHLKDSAGPPGHAMVDVGSGTIDFAAILRLDARQRATVKHVFVEHDQPTDPFAFASRSFAHLSQLEY